MVWVMAMKEISEVVEEVKKLVESKAVKIDRSNEMDEEIIHALFKNKLLGVLVPEELGGAGLGLLEASKVVEELAKVSCSVAHSTFVHNMAVDGILRFGNEEQKNRFLPILASKKLATAMITEPSGGSDVSNSIKMRAEKSGESYILNGTKTFITNSTHAEIHIVVARTGEGKKGLTAFVVEGNDGIEVTKLNPSGMRGSGLGTVRFNEVEVPEDNVLLGEGSGLKVALGMLAPARVPFSSIALGLAEGCLENTIAYIKRREAFGRKIAEFQFIQFKIAELFADIEAVKRLVYHAAELAGKQDITVLAAMAKLKSSELAKRAADFAVQLHGGYGIISNSYADRAYRDAKTLEIAEGTSEMMKLIISRAVLS